MTICWPWKPGYDCDVARDTTLSISLQYHHDGREVYCGEGSTSELFAQAIDEATAHDIARQLNQLDLILGEPSDDPADLIESIERLRKKS